MHIIENEILNVSVAEKGAELTSIYHKGFELEYMWNGDPSFWSKHSPILFPVVGALKNNTYYFKNKSYQLPRHGFAREMDFLVAEQSSNSITFSLVHDDSTWAIYPFEFELKILYSLNESELMVAYEVNNLSNDEMYFSIGGHPAFKVPLTENTDYEDYFLGFTSPENSGRWPVTGDGLIEQEPVPFFKNDSTLSLTKNLFKEDALVFKDLHSNTISLRCTKHVHGLDFEFQGFPYMGIWAAKNADFVCIEPWCGVADSVNTDQQIKNKEGINRLMKGESFNREWKVRLW